MRHSFVLSYRLTIKINRLAVVILGSNGFMVTHTKQEGLRESDGFMVTHTKQEGLRESDGFMVTHISRRG